MLHRAPHPADIPADWYPGTDARDYFCRVFREVQPLLDQQVFSPSAGWNHSLDRRWLYARFSRWEDMSVGFMLGLGDNEDHDLWIGVYCVEPTNSRALYRLLRREPDSLPRRSELSKSWIVASHRLPPTPSAITRGLLLYRNAFAPHLDMFVKRQEKLADITANLFLPLKT